MNESCLLEHALLLKFSEAKVKIEKYCIASLGVRPMNLPPRSKIAQSVNEETGSGKLAQRKYSSQLDHLDFCFTFRCFIAIYQELLAVYRFVIILQFLALRSLSLQLTQ